MATGPSLSSRDWGRDVVLEFDAYQAIDDYISEFIACATGDGLSVRVPVVCGPSGSELADFLSDLSNDFRGWTGMRSWRSLEDQLRVEATWHSGGHAELTFRLSPSIYARWAVTVSVRLEAGEELNHLAQEFRAFMSV